MITNLELTSQQPVSNVIAKMGLEEKIIKYKATHSSNQTIEMLNRDHPKPSGGKWWKSDVTNFLKKYRERCKDIAAEDASVAEGVNVMMSNTLKGVEKTNSLLNMWLDNLHSMRTVKCKSCGEDVEIFDTDKAVRICAEIRRTLMTVHQMTGGLPDVEQTQNQVGKAVEFTQMLDKMVHDGTIILVSKDKPIAEQVAKALGEKPELPKPRAIKLSIDGEEHEDS